MEVVYFLISFIEIVLCIFLVLKLRNYTLIIKEKSLIFEKNLPSFNKIFKQLRSALNILAQTSRFYKKAQHYKKYFDKIMLLKKSASFIQFIGELKNKKINKKDFLKKVLSFI